MRNIFVHYDVHHPLIFKQNMRIYINVLTCHIKVEWCALNQLSVVIYSIKSMYVKQINKRISVVNKIVGMKIICLFFY